MRPLPESVTDERFVQVLIEILRDHERLINGERMRGTTAQRPVGGWDGSWFDETLGKPIWWDGSQAVDATGAAV